METTRNPTGVPPGNILHALPPEVLHRTFGLLPAAHRFVSPVCRHFRDLYAAAVADKKNTNHTDKHSIATEAALTLYREEGSYFFGEAFQTLQDRVERNAGARL